VIKTAVRLKLNEGLDPVEPLDVFLLLLELGVIRDELGDALVDTTLLEELFELFLEADVKSVELRRARSAKIQ
jgi:hypothetical protein